MAALGALIACRFIVICNLVSSGIGRRRFDTLSLLLSMMHAMPCLRVSSCWRPLGAEARGPRLVKRRTDVRTGFGELHAA